MKLSKPTVYRDTIHYIANMPVKSLYACGSNLLGHIIPRSRDSNCGALDNFDQHELITQPHRVFANVGDARVLYAGLADVLCMY